MRRLTGLVLALGLFLVPTVASAEASITNRDANSYQYTMECGSTKREGSIAGGATNKFSIPAGATQCTITMKSNGTSCTIRDGESCTVQSGKISKN